MASGEMGVNRSSSRSASLWELPARSNQFLPLNSGGSSTSSRWMVRAVLVNANAIWILFVLCTIWNG